MMDLAFSDGWVSSCVLVKGDTIRHTILLATLCEHLLKGTKVLGDVLLVHLGQFLGSEGRRINFSGRHI